jgi:hypothetical protein
MMLSRTLGFASLLLLGACANSGTFRGLADKTGLVVTTLESGTAEFIANQNGLNTANAVRLDVLAANAAGPGLLARRQTLAWTAAGDTPRVAAFNLATQPTAVDILSALNTRATRFPPVAAGATADDYKAAREALVVLSTPPSRGDALAGILGYATEFRTSLATIRDEATAAAAAAAAAGAATDAAAQTSAASDAP